MPLENPPLLSAEEAAQVLTEHGFLITKTTLEWLSPLAGGPPYRLFGATPVYDRAALLAWAQASPSVPPSEAPGPAAPPRSASVREIMRLTGIPRSRIYRMIDRGVLIRVHVQGEPHLLLDIVRDYLAARRRPYQRLTKGA